MRPAIATICLLAVLAAGCGGSSTAPSTPRTTPDISRTPSALVLDAGDIGGTYLIAQSHTGRDNLKRTMYQDPPATRAIERSQWQSGYHAVYGSPNGDGVVTSVSVFRTETAAVAVGRSWQRSELKAFQGHLVAAPGTGLQHITAIMGSVPDGGQRRAACFIQWVHGRVLAGILAFGAEGSPRAIAKLAIAQDGRMTVAGA